MIVCLFSHALWPDPQPQTRGWTGCSVTQCPLVGINTQCCGKNIPWHWKGQLSTWQRHPRVSGPLASQTDRRKTVASYVINTTIIKIRGVLDSVTLYSPLPGMVNQIPLWNSKIKHILYVQSAQGQKAKASLGFAGVVSVVESLNFTVREIKRIQRWPFSSNAEVSKRNGNRSIGNILGQF